jgi:transcriptional regulator with XRE-family HTH domain
MLCAKLHLMATTFGDLVRLARVDRGWSQRELARRIKKSPTYIHYVERGSSSSQTKSSEMLVGKDALEKLIKVLGLDHNEAYIAAGYAPPPKLQKPKNLAELIAALENLGLPVPQLFGGFQEDEDGEGFQEALERIFLDLELVMKRLDQGRQRPRINIIDEDDGEEEVLPDRENQASRR